MADDVVSVVYAWVIDGVSTIFVTDEALADSWAVAAGFASTHPGLVPPSNLSAVISLRVGYPDPSTTLIKVKELASTDQLAALFGASRYDAADLVTTLEPATDPAGASLWGKHVGVEAIGSAGERRRYSCVPGFEPGLLHLGQNDAFANGAGAAPVSDGPVLWEGRRCAVYRVKFVAGAWQSLAAAKRIWWGQLRAKGVQGRGRWSFACLGPDSWLSKNLSVGNSQDGLRVIPALSLTEDGFTGESVMRASLNVRRLDDQIEVRHEYLSFVDASASDVDNYLSGSSTYADVATAVNDFLNDIVADTTNGIRYNIYGNDIYYDTGPGTDGLTIKWYRGDSVGEGDPYIDDDSADAERTVAVLRLIMHEKVWKTLGYDVRLQNSDRDPIENEGQYGQFESVDFGAPGYWSGTFYSASPKAMKGFETNDYESLPQAEYSSGGGTRRWPPIYQGGAVTFTGAAGQEFQVDTPDDVRLAGSKARPLMADPDDNASVYSIGDGVGDVTDQGLMVFDGLYRRRGDEDQVDPVAGYAFEVSRERREGRTVQVARVCWRSSGGRVETDTDNQPRFVVYEWLDPRLFGFDYLKFEGTWGGFRDPPPGASPIIVRPLTVWEYSDSGDLMATVLQRIMLTTGTAGGWYADAAFVTPLYGLGAGSAYLDVGVNDSGGTQPKDAEVYTMGLGIPSTMVQTPEEFAAAGDVAGPDLSRCKAALYGVASSQQLITTLLAPSGLAIGYAGGQFGIFDPFVLPAPTTAVATITPEFYAGEAGADPARSIPNQELRLWQAIDVVEIKGRREPLAGDYHVEDRRTASDFGAPYRGQQIVHRITADHVVDPSVPVAGANWQEDVQGRWRLGFEFWDAPNSTFTTPCHLEDAIDIWPQDGVLVTDPWLLSSAGVYGVSVAVGRVLERRVDCDKETVTLKVMLSAEAEFRMYGPSASVTRYDEQDLGPDFRLLCEDDALGDRGGNSYDVDGFEEPSWSTEGGNATIEVFQFDGLAWSGAIFGEVASVTGAVGASSITLTGALTGATWYPDKPSIVVLRVWAAQAAWPQRWYAAICEDDGTHTGGTPGEKWRGI